MDFKDLSICIPAFNEDKIIRSMLIELKKEFPDSEIIVVDDGSSDKTKEMAKSVEGITVLEHKQNIGYGGALKTAMQRANGEIVAWYDADGQHNPKDLKKVAQPVVDEKYEVVIGVRQKDFYQSVERIPGKMILKFIAQFVAKETIPDINSGMRCFKKNIIKKYLHLLPDGFSATTTSTLLMIKQRYKVGYKSIKIQKRVGKSSVKIVRDGWNSLVLIFRVLILFEAFRFFTLLAFLQICFAMFYGLYIAFNNKLGFPVFASMIFISGILTFFMGIICDQIVSMRKEKFEKYH